MISEDILWAQFNSFSGNITATELVIERPCPICRHNTGNGLLEFPEFQFFSDSDQYPKLTRIQQVQCTHCGALYMDPVYTQQGFQILFAEAAESYGASEGRVGQQTNWLLEHAQLDSQPRVIDLGCHTGKFLRSIPDTISRIGVDIDPRVIDEANRNSKDNLTFICSKFDQPLPIIKNTVISMLHVLEHLRDPVLILRKLKRSARKDTRLFIEVPLLEMGRTNDINGFLSVTHLTHFSHASLYNCLQTGGWEVEDEQPQNSYNGHRIWARPTNSNSNKPLDLSRVSDDIAKTAAYTKHWQDAVKTANKQLLPALIGDKCIIWGAGLHTEFLYQLTSLFQQGRQYLLIDSDPAKQGKTWRGIRVHPPEILQHASLSEIFVVISSYRNQEDIAASIKYLRGTEEHTVRIYDDVRSY